MGEEVAEYQGAYKGTQGLAINSGAKAESSTRADQHRIRLCRDLVPGAAMGAVAAPLSNSVDPR